MLNDDTVLMKQNKLAELTKRLLQDGFDVYITADHGNTPCTGLGRLTGSGVEVETRSHKMVVLKDFANKDSLIERYGLLEYPKYYLPKDYDYLICNVGDSLDIKGENVMRDILPIHPIAALVLKNIAYYFPSMWKSKKLI